MRPRAIEIPDDVDALLVKRAKQLHMKPEDAAAVLLEETLRHGRELGRRFADAAAEVDKRLAR